MWAFDPRATHVHFIGIGGIGMSALAKVLHAEGFRVSGSDLEDSAITTQLKQLGVEVFCGHDARYVDQVDQVVFSSCVGESNPERQAAQAAGIPQLSRGEMLAEIASRRSTVAVAGAHGKTTTTAMLALAAITSGADPLVCLGGEAEFLSDVNAHVGSGDLAVVEADESDGSFLWLQPSVAVVTNIDYEHLEYYSNWSDIRKAYAQFVSGRRPGGAAVVNAADVESRHLLNHARAPVVTFGLSRDAEVSATGVQLAGLESHFTCTLNGRPIGNVHLQVPGRHNIENALAAVAAGRAAGLPVPAILQALSQYRGTRRRFQMHRSGNGVGIIEDYAHHPTEIRATLSAARTCAPGRIVGIFQPHRYSRTFHLLDAFGRCFDDCDFLIVTDVYAASEVPLEGVSGASLSMTVSDAGHPSVRFVPKEQLLEYLEPILQPGDLVMVLGAGDVGHVATTLASRLATRDTLQRTTG